MRRFNDDNEEYRDDVENFFGEGNDEEGLEEVSDEEYENLLKEEEQLLQKMQLQFISRDLNHRVLRSAIRMSEKSFWWRFYSQETRLRIIEKVYKRFKKVQEEEDF